MKIEAQNNSVNSFQVVQMTVFKKKKYLPRSSDKETLETNPDSRCRQSVNHYNYSIFQSQEKAGRFSCMESVPTKILLGLLQKEFLNIRLESCPQHSILLEPEIHLIIYESHCHECLQYGSLNSLCSSSKHLSISLI